MLILRCLHPADSSFAIVSAVWWRVATLLHRSLTIEGKEHRSGARTKSVRPIVNGALQRRRSPVRTRKRCTVSRCRTLHLFPSADRVTDYLAYWSSIKPFTRFHSRTCFIGTPKNSAICLSVLPARWALGEFAGASIIITRLNQRLRRGC